MLVRQSGQGMTEYIIVVALVAVAAIAVYQLFGQVVRSQTAAMARELAGDATFFAILRTWYRDHRGGNVTTAEFIALAERKTGRQLDGFFVDWLYQAGRPAACAS